MEYIVITDSDEAGIRKFKAFLETQFQKKNMGPLKYLKGINYKVSRTRTEYVYLTELLFRSIERYEYEAPMIFFTFNSTTIATN